MLLSSRKKQKYIENYKGKGGKNYIQFLATPMCIESIMKDKQQSINTNKKICKYTTKIINSKRYTPTFQTWKISFLCCFDAFLCVHESLHYIHHQMATLALFHSSKIETCYQCMVAMYDPIYQMAVQIFPIYQLLFVYRIDCHVETMPLDISDHSLLSEALCLAVTNH